MSVLDLDALGARLSGLIDALRLYPAFDDVARENEARISVLNVYP